jgi:hypothetical protein
MNNLNKLRRRQLKVQETHDMHDGFFFFSMTSLLKLKENGSLLPTCMLAAMHLIMDAYLA